MSDEQLLLSYRAGNQDALQELMKKFERTMTNLSKRYSVYATKYGLDVSDLQQEGWIAFIEAVNTYEIRQDNLESCLFRTYAYTAAEFAIKATIRNSKPMGYKSTKEQPILFSMNQPTSSDDEENEFAELIPDPLSNAEIDNFIQSEYIRQLRKDLLVVLDQVFGEPIFIQDKFIINRNLLFLCKFNINPKCILALHYGLFGEPMTFKEIADEIGCSENAVSEYEKTALWKIRNSKVGVELMKNYAYEQYENIVQKKKESSNPYTQVSNMETVKELINQLDSIFSDD